jgi:E3 ubiquitin-protein ligase HUWE1
MHKIRWFNLKDSQEHASYFLPIRYIAIVILTQLLPEEQAELKIFMVDPELVVQASSLLIHPSELPHSLRFITCALIENIAHYRGRLNEVLGAVNASVNHGHIIQSIRKILDGSSGDGIEVLSTDYSIEFIESLFNFVSYILSSSSGGSMLISAGLVPILSSALQSKSPLKTIAKCIVMLDWIQSETPTTNIDVNAVVERIKREVDLCLGLKSQFREEDLVFSSVADPGNLPHFRGLFHLFIFVY